ncbi:hypothetical protein MSI_17110 [Treponema sp. JC4]|uniref:DUF3841 domain-containing protein n=1 Tax=Treponema sp. JC4 TaxID=1124982 RepID=UPI00025B02F7|nr:DUF3841 domain-containing protein [Treponema sp. JC4]EID84763.1 hypothetical protein MSI_17110 [Treponema sp. JC4]
MRLWTIQPENVYNLLISSEFFYCKPELSECLSSFNFENAYSWLVSKMENLIGPKPPYVKYPVWAWHTFDGKHSKPDLRKTEFRYFTESSVCIEIEIPDKDCCLTDEEEWHIVLNNCFNTKYLHNLDFENAEECFEKLPPKEQKFIKEKSWDCIFDISQSNYIQATFWELRKENIIRTWSIK